MKKQKMFRQFVSFSLMAMLALSSTPALASITWEEGTLTVVAPSEHGPEIVYPEPTPPANIDSKDSNCGSLSLHVNGSRVSSDLYFQGNTLLLPVRAIAGKTGWDYSYKSGTATLKKGSTTVTLIAWGSKYSKNGSDSTFSGYAELISDRLYAPWGFFEKALNMNVNIGSKSVKVSSRSGSSSSSKSYSLRVNGKKSSVAPYYSDKILMIPLRFTTETLGYSYVNDSANRRAVFSAKDVDCFINWNENKYPVDNEYVQLECKPQIRNNTLFVPVSFVQNALKCNVSVSSSGRVTITR